MIPVDHSQKTWNFEIFGKAYSVPEDGERVIGQRTLDAVNSPAVVMRMH